MTADSKLEQIGRPTEEPMDRSKLHPIGKPTEGTIDGPKLEAMDKLNHGLIDRSDVKPTSKPKWESIFEPILEPECELVFKPMVKLMSIKKPEYFCCQKLNVYEIVSYFNDNLVWYELISSQPRWYNWFPYSQYYLKYCALLSQVELTNQTEYCVSKCCWNIISIIWLWYIETHA